jgi:very-short-patch-repair endonuclease
VRQHPIGPYIADFACRSARLVVEVDGSQRVDSAHDRKRDAFMAGLGYAVLRVPSVSVLTRRSDVCDTILAALDGRLRQPVSTLDLTYVPALT